jgi:transcriptional regulator with XRE-family HTH domain
MTEEEYLKAIGKAIESKREKLGMSRELLGEKVGLSRMHIYRIEKGTHPTTIIFLRRIADELKLPLGKIVELKN